MLELKSVAWRNFMSYGDYETTLELDQLGQCLITGQVNDDDKSLLQASTNPLSACRSNGAGKSTVVNVIQWVLFGRTMHSASPGDKVINFFTGKNCWAKITFKNGDSILRTRKVGNHSELHYVKDGNDTSLTSDTLSTARNQQKQLNREFGLDWEVFSGSVFFNQYGKPWMEMADSTRKKAIERVLHVDKFAYYAENANSKCQVLDKQIEDRRRKIETNGEAIGRAENNIERLQRASDNYGASKKERMKERLQQAVQEKEKRGAIEKPDLDKLKGKWAIVDKIEARISKIQKDDINRLNREISSTEGDIDSLKSKIKRWEAKSGKVCNACEQPVPDTHTAAKIEPISEMLEEKQEELKTKKEELAKVRKMLKVAETMLQERKPDMTMRAAKDLHSSWDRHTSAIKRLTAEVAEIKAETNPHTEAIAEAKGRVEKYKADMVVLEKEIEEDTYLNRHYKYIYKAYNDRTKIKSFVFKEHIPFINSRLRHYLDVFGLDIQLELTPALGIKSNMWGYEFESGGERKRTDVAFMLAMFDFHEQMYGRQCNILVLDEVDGRLDDDGIESLIDIIKSDLAPKVETVLIISHRNMMHDTFPCELRVARTDRFSQIIQAGIGV